MLQFENFPSWLVCGAATHAKRLESLPANEECLVKAFFDDFDFMVSPLCSIFNDNSGFLVFLWWLYRAWALVICQKIL